MLFAACGSDPEPIPTENQVNGALNTICDDLQAAYQFWEVSSLLDDTLPPSVVLHSQDLAGAIGDLATYDRVVLDHYGVKDDPWGDVASALTDYEVADTSTERDTALAALKSALNDAQSTMERHLHGCEIGRNE
jgi:hypothetical protein